MVFEWLKRLIKRKSINQSDESINQSDESINQSQINQSINDIRLQKDSLELGLAAGYAGHSLKSLESSMERLESSVITKQWSEAYLLPLLKSIDDNEQRRFETLLTAVNYLKGTSFKAPKHIQLELQKPIQELEKEISESPKLTPQMRRLFSILETVDAISYPDLAHKMDISEDGLRGFLSIVNKKMPNKIDRFDKEGKRKWVRLKRSQNETISNQSLNQSDMFSMFNEENQTNEQTDKQT